MSQQQIELLTPVGRLVQGNPFEGNTKDATGRPLVYKTGANAGQPRVDYFMAIAIPKTDPGVQDIITKIQTAAQAGFPNGEFNAPTFAWKIIDGDGVDAKGQPHANKQGFAGNYIFKFSGGYAPKCYSAGGAAVLTDPASIKRGYYIRIYGSTVANMSAQQPGVYLNHSAVELIGYGEEIQTGPDGAAVFGGQPAGALPAGASATPIAPATPMAQPPAAVPGAAPMPAPAAPMPAAVAPVAAPVPAAPVPGMVAPAPAVAPAPGAAPAVAPHPGFVAPGQ